MSEKAEAIICTILGFTVGATSVALALLKIEPKLFRWIVEREEKKDAK